MCTPHTIIVLAISVLKIITDAGNLTKFWQKQFCFFFWDTVYIALLTCIQFHTAKQTKLCRMSMHI